MPSIDIGGSACSGPTAAQLQYAPGLKNCPSLATQIQTCQSLGKKVFLSVGGYIANSSFTSDLEARNFALTVWNLFGAGNTLTALRPFGGAIIDGIDIDNEDGDSAHWDAFTSALRALFNSDPSKQYYISAAPQCPYPDVSIPSYTLQHADFVWVQFYNNPSCNLDSNTFQSSFVQWSRALRNTTVSKTPRLFIGAGSFPGAGTGFVPASAFSSRVSLAKELFVNNFGGVMLWDGGEGLRIVDQYGHSYLQYAKWALQY